MRLTLEGAQPGEAGNRRGATRWPCRDARVEVKFLVAGTKWLALEYAKLTAA